MGLERVSVCTSRRSGGPGMFFRALSRELQRLSSAPCVFAVGEHVEVGGEVVDLHDLRAVTRVVVEHAAVVGVDQALLLRRRRSTRPVAAGSAASVRAGLA